MVLFPASHSFVFGGVWKTFQEVGSLTYSPFVSKNHWNFNNGSFLFFNTFGRISTSWNDCGFIGGLACKFAYMYYQILYIYMFHIHYHVYNMHISSMLCSSPDPLGSNFKVLRLLTAHLFAETPSPPSTMSSLWRFMSPWKAWKSTVLEK